LKFGAGPEREAANAIRLFHLEREPLRRQRQKCERLVADIIDEAVYAKEVGLHSAWIGEHHFSTLGVLSCADLVLANVAARTRHLRLAPAVTVLPLQIRSASPSNG